MHRLLSEAESCKKLKQQEISKQGQDTMIHLVRLTILWSPPRSLDTEKIVVRGHACSTGHPIRIHAFPEPIVVTIAAHAENGDQESVTVDKSLPTRFSNPENKIASWCRLRRTMETRETYKPPGVHEVLMVRQLKDEHGKQRLELLEGLSSNVFVVYKDATLRTATDGVLSGFVRHLVLESSSECGIKFDPRPIFLHESGDWQEVFITSSSRLIYPVSKILIPKEGNESSNSKGLTAFKEYWHDPKLEAKNSKKPKWQDLLNVILKKGGYHCLEANQPSCVKSS